MRRWWAVPCGRSRLCESLSSVAGSQEIRSSGLTISCCLLVVLLTVGLLAFRARYKGSYGRLGTAGVFVIFGGYALLFFGSLPAVLFSSDGPVGFVRVGQDLGFLGAVVALVGALLLGIALRRSGVASRLGSLLLIVAFPVGLLGVIVVLSGIGFEDIAGLPWTVLYRGAWIVLGSLLGSQRDELAERQQPACARHLSCREHLYSRKPEPHSRPAHEKACPQSGLRPGTPLPTIPSNQRLTRSSLGESTPPDP